jgi:hypothetical protein
MGVLYPLQRSVPPHRRTARWVGKPRILLAERLYAKLAEMGYDSEIDCAKISPQQGAWRTNHRLDVMRLEGSLRMRRDGHWFDFNLESWSTITEMLRHGFTVEVDGFTVSIEASQMTPIGFEHCLGCGLLTHTAEAACLHCGHTKAWAQPDIIGGVSG